jgi:hypothetical protein
MSCKKIIDIRFVGLLQNSDINNLVSKMARSKPKQKNQKDETA